MEFSSFILLEQCNFISVVILESEIFICEERISRGSKKPYQLTVRKILAEVNSELEQARGPNP
jgi:hypothetical protein